ncbi:MAG TPA: hypothetical protein VFL90_07795 [Methylomirabilota bacterium]|nr:hypothetical protein [Methylomirabilota bacterium]
MTEISTLSRALTLAVLLLVAGCAGPARSTPTAAATAGGVEVAATTDAWRGWPPSLPTLVTPIHVRVVNRGDVPVRLESRLFALVLPDGRRLAAAPPSEVRGVVAGPAPTVRQDEGLALGPGRDRSGPGWALNDRTADARVDATQEPDATWELPSADMVAAALPEGVLAPGATASGFLYFERARIGAEPSGLTAQLLDARTGEPIGTVEVPLAAP